jgi:hypothetical protein
LALVKGSGFSLSVDWAGVYDETEELKERLESPQDVRDLVLFCIEKNPSFREAMLLVRSSLAENKPMLPRTTAAVLKKFDLSLPSARTRTPREELVHEVFRMFCLTPEAQRDTASACRRWMELSALLGKQHVRRIMSELNKAGLIALTSKHGRVGFRPSAGWCASLDTRYLGKALYDDARDWDCVTSTERNRGTETLAGDANGMLTAHPPDQFVVHALHGVAAGAITIDLEWKDNYHHSSKGRHRNPADGHPTGLFLRRNKEWMDEDAAHLDAVRAGVQLRGLLRERIVALLAQAGVEGIALRKLLAVPSLLEGGFALADIVWALIEMDGDDELTAVAAEGDVHMIAPEHKDVYSFEGILLQPRWSIEGLPLTLTPLLRAVADNCMRYPRITLSGLQSKMHTGLGLIWHLVAQLISAGVLRFEVFPVLTGTAGEFELELLPCSMPVAKLAKLLQPPLLLVEQRQPDHLRLPLSGDVATKMEDDPE